MGKKYNSEYFKSQDISGGEFVFEIDLGLPVCFNLNLSIIFRSSSPVMIEGLSPWAKRVRGSSSGDSGSKIGKMKIAIVSFQASCSIH
jgi:hypothetical protein